MSPSNPAQIYVLDASVAFKWFLPPGTEPLADEALRVLQAWDTAAIGLVVPDIFWSEIGAVLVKATRRGRMARTDADEALKRLLASRLPTVSGRQLVESAFPVALAYGCSLYDCVYVTLAMRLQTSLITADERLVNALGSRFPVRWLGASQAL